MERLHKSCRRLIWLNPLLRFDGFEPRARGVRAMLPHVDELRPVHNLKALADLCASLVGTRLARDRSAILARGLAAGGPRDHISGAIQETRHEHNHAVAR